MTTQQDSSATEHWLIARRVRDYPKLVLGVIAVAIPLYASTFEGGVDFRGQPPGSDFIAFWSAARLALDGAGAGVYDLATISAFQRAQFPDLAGPTPWVHPPFFLLLVIPLGLLPHGVAFLVWTAVGLGVFLAALRPLLTTRSAWWLTVAFPGLWIGLGQGQTQFVTAALIGGALLRLQSRPVLAGVLIGLLAIKPHLAILLPLALIAGRHWRAFAAAAITTLTATAAGVVAFGWQSMNAWVGGMDLVKNAVNVGALPTFKFVTPYTGLRLMGLPEAIALVTHACVALVAAVVVWRIWRRTDDMNLRGPSMIVATFLVTPYAADYDLALLAFAIAWLALAGLEEGWLRGDRNLLVAMWVLPIISAPIAAVTHLCVAPLFLGAVLRQTWVRATNDPEHPHVTRVLSHRQNE